MPENKKIVLELKNVEKAFGGVITSDCVSFQLYAGEILGLIGPNGAGKTTTLNLISGIYDVDGGEIWFDGKNVTKAKAHDRAHMGLARTFQTPRFLQRSNIKDNMLLGADLAGNARFGKSFFQKRNTAYMDEVEELMKLAGFPLDWDDDISSIPYGNRKLLEIVRALLTHPKAIMVDEPAAGLNSKEIERVVELLNYAARKKNIGIILIEHAMDLVMNTCDRIVVLNFGKMIAYGTPGEVSSNPAVIEAYLGRG